MIYIHNYTSNSLADEPAELPVGPGPFCSMASISFHHLTHGRPRRRRLVHAPHRQLHEPPEPSGGRGLPDCRVEEPPQAVVVVVVGVDGQPDLAHDVTCRSRSAVACSVARNGSLAFSHPSMSTPSAQARPVQGARAARSPRPSARKARAALAQRPRAARGSFPSSALAARFPLRHGHRRPRPAPV